MKLRKLIPLSQPVIINRANKEFYGFELFEDEDNNVTVRAFYRVPNADGTIDKVTVGINASTVLNLPELIVVVAAIIDASK